MVHWSTYMRGSRWHKKSHAARFCERGGSGLGGALLAYALDRVTRSEIATYALIVDAKDEVAVGFYRHHGFLALPDLPLTLFLPLATTAAPRKTDNKRFSPI
ncbi:MAG: GNAT family N-acetyltransferase [Acidithiobacillus sp.]|uniref:GNAT family N-acetyltransferase n=1 Tax=Acidithiobacillus sp. TaxID=1872118 RepID=UPI00355FF173